MFSLAKLTPERTARTSEASAPITSGRFQVNYNSRLSYINSHSVNCKYVELSIRISGKKNYRFMFQKLIYAMNKLDLNPMRTINIILFVISY